VEIDFSDLMRLEADLRAAPAKAHRNVRKAVEVTARYVKDDWREGAEISSFFPKTYAASIDYDIKTSSDVVEAEIGPSLGKTPGASAGFLEEAPGNVRARPIHAGRDALKANEEDFSRGLLIAISDAVEDG